MGATPPTPPPAAGVLTWRHGDRATAARRRLEQGLALFRAAGDGRGVAACLDHLAGLAEERGERDLGRTQCEESLALRRELGDRRGIAASLGSLGRVALAEGDGETAGRLLQEGLARYRELGNKAGAATTLVRLAALAEARGDDAQAMACYEEGLALCRAWGHSPGVASVLYHLGRTALRQGDAARLEAGGARLQPVDRAEYERDLAAVRARLGATAFGVALAVGRTLTPEQAVAVALEDAPDAA